MTTQPEGARSEVLGAVHEAAYDLHDADVMDEPTLRRLDAP